MKKIILLFVALIISISAAKAEVTDKICVDVKQQLAANITEATILDNLLSPACAMSMDDAIKAIISNGGNQTDTLVAAVIINPDYKFTPTTDTAQSDPTSGLKPSAAGNDPTAGLQASAAGANGSSSRGVGGGVGGTGGFGGAGSGGSGGGGGAVSP